MIELYPDEKALIEPVRARWLAGKSVHSISCSMGRHYHEIERVLQCIEADFRLLPYGRVSRQCKKVFAGDGSVFGSAL